MSQIQINFKLLRMINQDHAKLYIGHAVENYTTLGLNR